MSRAGLRALALGVLLGSAARPRGPHPAAGAASAAAALAAPAPPPPATASPPSRADHAGRGPGRALATPAFARAQTALVVRSLASGETLYRRNGPTWLVPASTMKVLTAVAAAERLGWGFRFETRLVAMGPVAQRHAARRPAGRRRRRPVDQRHATAAAPTPSTTGPARSRPRASAIIAGHVVGDDSAVEQPGWGVGWAWDDLVEGYGAAYAALQYHEGEVAVTIGPGMTPGAPAVVYLSPSNHGLLVNNLAITGPAGSEPALGVARLPGTRFLDVTGRMPLGGHADVARSRPWPTRRCSSPKNCARRCQARHRRGRRRRRHRRPERPAAGRRGPGAAGRPVAAARRARGRDAEVEPQRPRRGAAVGARRVAAGDGAGRAAGDARDAGQPRHRA